MDTHTLKDKKNLQQMNSLEIAAARDEASGGVRVRGFGGFLRLEGVPGRGRLSDRQWSCG